MNFGRFMALFLLINAIVILIDKKYDMIYWLCKNLKIPQPYHETVRTAWLMTANLFSLTAFFN